MQTIEDLFVTCDIDQKFNMIEDESGDIWWGYGHRDATEFTNEVNRWLIHACGATVPDDLFAVSQPVEHLWARMNPKYDERFDIVESTGTEADAAVFPVTRLMV